MDILQDRPMLAAGYVYGIECVPFIKIGVARDVNKRLATIRLHNPFPCVVIFKRKTVAPYHFEKKMHELLKGRSVGREWFQTTLDEIQEAAKLAGEYARHVYRTEVEQERDWRMRRDQESVQRITKVLDEAAIQREQINAGTYSQ